MSNPYHKELYERLEILKELLTYRSDAENLENRYKSSEHKMKIRDYRSFIKNITPFINRLIELETLNINKLSADFMKWNLNNFIKYPNTSIDSIIPKYEDNLSFFCENDDLELTGELELD